MQSDIDEVSDDGSTVWREVESEREESVVGDTADIHQVTTEDDFDLIEQEESKDYFPTPTKIPFIPIEPPLSIQKPSAISPVNNEDLQRLSEKLQSPGPKAVSSIPPFMKWRVVKKVKSFLTVIGLLLGVYLLDLLSNGFLRQSISDVLQVTPNINLIIFEPEARIAFDSTFVREESMINQYESLDGHSSQPSDRGENSSEDMKEAEEEDASTNEGTESFSKLQNSAEEKRVIEAVAESVTTIEDQNNSKTELQTYEHEQSYEGDIESSNEDIMEIEEEVVDTSEAHESISNLQNNERETISNVEEPAEITVDPSPEIFSILIEVSDLSSPSTVIISEANEDVDFISSSSMLPQSELISAYKFVQPLLPNEKEKAATPAEVYNSSAESHVQQESNPVILPSLQIKGSEDQVSWNWIIVSAFFIVAVIGLAFSFHGSQPRENIQDSETSILENDSMLLSLNSPAPRREVEIEGSSDRLVISGEGLTIQTNPPRQSEELYISPATTNSGHDSTGSSPFNSTEFPNLIHASMIDDTYSSNTKTSEDRTSLCNVNKTLYQPNPVVEEEATTGRKYFLRSSMRKNHPYYLRSDDDDNSVTSDITHNAIVRKAKANLSQPRTRRSAALNKASK